MRVRRNECWGSSVLGWVPDRPPMLQVPYKRFHYTRSSHSCSPDDERMIRKNIEALHGLRGIAVLYVVLSHYGSALPLLPFSTVAIGKVGVWIFFTLSAFLLTRNLTDELAKRNEVCGIVAEYGIHRIFRIYPMYLLVISLHWLSGDLPGRMAIEQALLVAGWRELWAIPVEFQYYVLIVPIAIAAGLLRRSMASNIMVLAFLASLPYAFSHPDAIFSNDIVWIQKAAPFLLGSTLAIAITGKQIPAARADAVGVAAIVLLAISSVGYQSLYVRGLDPAYAPFIHVAISVAAAGLVYCSLSSGVLAKPLHASPLVCLEKSVSASTCCIGLRWNTSLVLGCPSGGPVGVLSD